MPLAKEEIDSLLRLVSLTKDTEIDCDQCLALVAAFAERELSGRSICEGLKAVEDHLAICAECREEYQALQQALKDIES